MKRICCIGDSNTFGHDPRSRIGEPYGDGVRWAGRLAQQGFEVINTGRNGLSIPLERDYPALGERLRSIGPVGAVTVMLGTNDLLRGADAGTAADRMEKLLGFLHGNVGEAKLVLIAPPPMIRGEWVPTDSLIEESKGMTEKYRELAERAGVVFADAGEWGVELTFDGVHFTAAGHAAFAEGLKAVLEQILA